MHKRQPPQVQARASHSTTGEVNKGVGGSEQGRTSERGAAHAEQLARGTRARTDADDVSFPFLDILL